MRRATLAALLAGCLPLTGLLGGCTSEKSAAKVVKPPVIDPTDFHHGPADTAANGDTLVDVSTLARHLDVPWGITFLPDGAAVVTERQTLRVLLVGPGRQPDGDLTVTPAGRIAEATADNEGGLLGIAASPNYRQDKTLFVYYTTKTDNRIARMRLGGRPLPIVTGIPKGGIHDGGRLAFGPDGYLYATTGEASHTESAQSLTSLGGKTLRMTTDGKPAPGNPFPNSLIWSYGHRNPEGLAWDGDGNMYSTEIGEAVWDELNVILPGRNYGWPKVEGIKSNPQYVDPMVAWHPEVGVSSGVAITGNTAVITCLRGQRIYLVTLDGTVARDVSAGAHGPVAGGDTGSVRWRPSTGVTARPVEALTGKYGRLRTAITAPDGSVWMMTSNRDGRKPGGPDLEDDRILRLTLRPR